MLIVFDSKSRVLVEAFSSKDEFSRVREITPGRVPTRPKWTNLYEHKKTLTLETNYSRESREIIWRPKTISFTRENQSVAYDKIQYFLCHREA